MFTQAAKYVPAFEQFACRVLILQISRLFYRPWVWKSMQVNGEEFHLCINNPVNLGIMRVHTIQSSHCYCVIVCTAARLDDLPMDLMHMTSQKGAPARWGSNEALPRAPSPSMQPAGQPLACTYQISGLALGPRTDWEAERQRALPAQHVRAARQVLTPNMASLLWRRDVNA